MEDKGLEFKILLLIDNASGHPDLEHPNVKVVFLPPNKTSLIQPLDQGVISTFKSYYIQRTFEYIIDELEKDGTLSIFQAWKKFTLINCVKYAALALSKSKPSTLNAYWRSIWSECVKTKYLISNINTDELHSIIITLSHQIGRGDFKKLAFEDIAEVTTHEAPNEEQFIESISENLYDSTLVYSSDDEEVVPLLQVQF
ncbi:transposable element-derived 1 [Octopus vulgaris]|uniref:Transposable element-derived 1 n=1 Tax=Octopus vulgaris TaxID=6645 RepID=A0AA36F5U2_OCTVU|nr:transposable element-derived 1 [Octopus vulgaris]